MTMPTPGQPWTPPAPPRKRNTTKIVLLAVAGVLGLCVSAGAVGALLDTGKTSAPGTTVGPVGEVGVPARPAVTTRPAAARPAASQFRLTPKITEKQCFGSAGCNVTLKVQVGYHGAPLSEDDTWEVTYEISGDESGPIIGSFETTGTTYDVRTEMLSTKSSKTKIAIKVTDVEKVGI